MKHNIASIKRTKSQDLKFEMLLRHIEKMGHNQHPAREILGLSDEAHTIYYHDGDSMTEFWIESGLEDYTDEELREYCRDMECHNNTPYDCSGLMVTYWITFHRNPTGLVSFTHHKVLDV